MYVKCHRGQAGLGDAGTKVILLVINHRLGALRTERIQWSPENNIPHPVAGEE